MGLSLQSAPVSLLDKLFLSLLFVFFNPKVILPFSKKKKGLSTIWKYSFKGNCLSYPPGETYILKTCIKNAAC